MKTFKVLPEHIQIDGEDERMCRILAEQMAKRMNESSEIQAELIRKIRETAIQYTPDAGS